MNESTIVFLSQPDAVIDYKRVLVRFMAWLHGKPVSFGSSSILFNSNDVYPTNHEFPTNELLAITPEDIVRWMSLMAYHNTNPMKEDHPVYATKNSLKYTKKAISHFMIHTHIQWNEITKFGNPTRSKKVNALIQLVGKMETRDLGKASNADRAFEYEEVNKVMKLLSKSERKSSPVEHAMYTCMFTYQCHFIARIDDVSKSKKQWLSAHPEHPYCIMGRLPWSKNVLEQRDSPWQIIVGGDEWNVAPLCNLP